MSPPVEPDDKPMQSFKSVAEAASELDLHDTSFDDLPPQPHNGADSQSTTKFLVLRNRRLASLAAREEIGSITSGLLGNSKVALLPRLLILWTVVLPALLIRTFVLVFIVGFFAGGVWTATVAVAAPAASIGFYHAYRPVLKWAQNDWAFQFMWDLCCTVASFFFNTSAFVIRLSVEIWNGFVPFLDLFINLIYEIIRQCVVIVLNMPILQYAFFWILRFHMYTIEAAIEFCMTVASAFSEFAKGMASGLQNMIEGDQIHGFRRQGVPLGDPISADIYVPVGEVTLHIAVLLITLMYKCSAAFIKAFGNLILSFMLKILPMLINLLPVIWEIAVKLFNVFTSDPMRRIFDAFLKLLPIALRIFQAIVCLIVPYLGAAICYTLYILAIVFGFYIKYIARPLVCSSYSILGGCFRSYVYAAMAGDQCYSCGAYNTACGCEKYYVPSNSHDCSSTCHDPNGVIIPVVAPPAEASDKTRNYTNMDTSGDRFNAVIVNPHSLDDMYDERNAGPDDSGDIQVSNVSAGIDTAGSNWDTCVGSADPACVADNSAATTEYDLSQPAVRRRRTMSNAAPRPNATGPTSAPTGAPTIAPTVDAGRRRSSTKVTPSTYTETLVSSKGVFTSSPGQYAEMVAQFQGSKSVYRMGSLAYRNANPLADGIVCVGGNGNVSDCSTTTTANALASMVGSTPFDTETSAGRWLYTEWLSSAWLRVDLSVPSNATRVEVTWQDDGDFLLAPSRYKVTTVHADGTQRTMDVDAPCSSYAGMRIDTVALPSDPLDVVAVHLAFNGTYACSAPNYDTGVFRVQSLLVWGWAKSDYSLSDLRTSSGLKAYASVYARNASFWDPCASGQPQRVVDGQRDYPALFWADRPGGSLGISLKLRDDSGAVDVWLGNVTVHLAATNHLPASSVRLCTKDVANWTAALSDASCTAAYEPVNYDHLWNSQIAAAQISVVDGFWRQVATNSEDSGGWYNAPFLEQTYVERDPWPMRGGHLRFVVGRSTSSSSVTLWIGPDALNSTRATNWDLAMLENGMHVVQHAAAQWMLPIQAALNANGKTARRVFSTSYCDEDLDSPVADVNLTHVASYALPFGSTTALRKWVGITEIDFQGRVLGSGRRAEKVEPGHGSSEAREADLEAHVRTKRREERAIPHGHLYTVDSVMARRGLHTFKHGLSDSAEGHDVRRLQSLAAPDGGHQHPFFHDLSQMPDPDDEPRFTCLEYKSGDQDRMKCHLMDVGALPGPSVVEDEQWRPEDLKSWGTGVGSLLKDHPAMEKKLRDTSSVIEQRTFLRNLQMSRHLQATALAHRPGSVGRHLMGAIGDAVNPWNAVKPYVMSAIDNALSLLEQGITAALGCSHYCTPAYHCTDDRKLGQCIPAVLQFIVGRMFQCDSDQSIYDCTIGRLIKWVLTMLEYMLDFLLRLVDLMGEGVGTMFGLGDLLKIISCWACSIAQIILGVLADFADDFPLSGCTHVVDMGTAQCARWDMGSGGEAGAAIFENFLPLLLVLFGVVQVLPALADVLLETALVIFSNLLEVFPELLEDGYVLTMWLVSSSGVVGTVETLYEAIAPLILDANFAEWATPGSDFRRNASPAPEWVGAYTDKAVWDDNSDPDGMDVLFETDSIGAGNCYQASSTPVDATCVRSPTNTSIAGRNALADQLTGSAQGSYLAARSGNLPAEVDLGGCGCAVVRGSCYDGPGTGNCPVKESTASLRRQAQIINATLQAQNGDPDDTSSWPQCADVTPQVFDADGSSAYGSASGEVVKTMIQSRKCYLQSRSNTVTGGQHNNMALQSILSRNMDPVALGGKVASWWPFRTFSREDGDVTRETDSDFYRSQFPKAALFEPTLEQTFRRRAQTDDTRRANVNGTKRTRGPSMRTLEQRAEMGVSYFFSDATEEQNEHARRAVREMMFRNNRTYAQQQVHGLRELFTEMGASVREAIRGSEMPETKYVKNTANYVMASARSLLGLSLTKKDLTDLACGFTKDADSPPNTYPCAKHIWFSIPPPITREWRFEKIWISWKEGWVTDTLCPELGTYGAAYLFAIRAMAKTVRSLAAVTVNVWPIDSMIQAMWSFATFPDDTWPQSKLHPPGEDVAFQLLCVALNTGPFVLLAVITGILMLTWSVWVRVFKGTLVIIDDVMNDYTEQELELARHTRERDEAIRVERKLASMRDS
jgi:hypothetical protein